MGKSQKIYSKIVDKKFFDLIKKIQHVNELNEFFKEIGLLIIQNFPQIHFAVFKYVNPARQMEKILKTDFSDEVLNFLHQAGQLKVERKHGFFIIDNMHFLPIKDEFENTSYVFAFRNINQNNIHDIQLLCEDIQIIYRLLQRNYNLGYENSTIEHANMISQICHDFNSLISLVNENKNQQKKKFDEMANSAGKMTKDVLLYVREVELIMGQVDISELIESIVEKGNIPDNIELEIKSKIKSKTLSVDVELIDRAISEILENSIFAIERKKGKLTIELEINNSKLFFDDFQWLIIKIIDNGSGIQNDYLPFIKNPFFTTRKAESHSGLGLPIAEKIIKAHRGYMDVQSKQDQHTIVSIFLPIRKSGDDEL